MTVGPATASPDVLQRLIEEGTALVRFNFSHGDLAEHETMLAALRQTGRVGQGVALLGDLCGPRIRLGPLAESIAVRVGQPLTIHRQEACASGDRITTNYPRFVDDVQVGHRVLIDDGNVHLLVTATQAHQVECTCTRSGVIGSRKGVNLPDTPLWLEAVTPFDFKCVRWAIRHDFDYLALSFVGQAKDLKPLRAFLETEGSSIGLVAKIERPEALAQIDPIIEASDGLMVARGDLGVQMDVAQVPLIQKDLVRRCRAAGKPVIVATQMLQSMIHSPNPTRAEVSDVANAILDGTDAVMLSGETSVGQYPALAVHTIRRVAEHTEAYLRHADVRPPKRMVQADPQVRHAALARGVWQMVHDLDARALIVASQTGLIARLFSNLRFHVPIIAFSSSKRVVRQMALYYGVVPICLDLPADGDPAPSIDRALIRHGIAGQGELIVLVGVTGDRSEPETIDGAVVHTIGQTRDVSA